MARKFLHTLLTSAVRRQQQVYYGRAHPDRGDDPQPDRMGSDELAFVGERDSFYLATISENGWPYVQHRGGPKGFLRALDDHTLLFADYGGNRQLISAGNLQSSERVCLFLMDYRARSRLKILGHSTVHDARTHAELVAMSAPPGGHPVPVERIFRIAVHAFDWNCPKFITVRYPADEVEAALAALRDRIAELEASRGHPEKPGPAPTRAWPHP